MRVNGSVTTMAPALEAVDLFHRYGRTIALDHVSLTVAEGEFVTVLGPSGSGKTTLLRVVGGFELATEAEALRIAGNDVRGLPPNHRPVATVFQYYALFPHMTVGENVEYGLKLRKVPPVERQRRADAALALVRLHDKRNRRIHQLSGGERQRVAFARAFVTEPRILLLDEPMGALDEKLRREMQIEVRDLQRMLGTTFLQVTHSQEEALTMSDRIVVMNAGRIEQIGAPRAIFECPASRFVADFMGLRNVVDGRVAKIDGDIVAVESLGLHLAGRWSGSEKPSIGAAAFFAIHPKKITVTFTGDGVPGTVRTAVYKGADVEVEVTTAAGQLVVSSSGEAPADGSAMLLTWAANQAVTGPVAVVDRPSPSISQAK